MSEYDETVDGNERICPYCGDSYQVEAEDYSEDTREETCYSCGKKYYACESFSVDHHAEPDCELNGEEHQWETHDLLNGKQHDFCAICNKCKPYPKV